MGLSSAVPQQMQQSADVMHGPCQQQRIAATVMALTTFAVSLYPEVGAALDWLSAQSETKGRVRMTGSGACVFAVFDDPATAQAVCDRLPAAGHGWMAWVCPGLDRHPLSDLIPV